MLVLASASPRRQELLRNAGILFDPQPADVDETPLAGESARDCAERLSREKALTVWRRRPQDVVLGADTVVVVGGRILGKPVDAPDAARMLRMLAGREHEVITAVAVVAGRSVAHTGESPLLPKSGRSGAPSRDRLLKADKSELGTENWELRTGSETTRVSMSEISDEEIREYVMTGEPMDKAGAYAIQGRASRWIPRIEGDYSNVVGLPIALVYRMLREWNLNF
jgi:septum formation protein